MAIHKARPIDPESDAYLQPCAVCPEEVKRINDGVWIHRDSQMVVGAGEDLRDPLPRWGDLL